MSRYSILEGKMYTQKGQMAGMAVGNIITLIVGIGVGVLVLVFVGTLGGQTYQLTEDEIDAIANNVVTGDTFTALNNTAVDLDHGFVQASTLRIYNNTAPYTEIGLNNFTIDYDAASVLLKVDTGMKSLNNSVLGANYTWGASEVRSLTKSSIVSGFEALEQTGDYIPIVVLAVVIALVLGMVLSFTVMGRGSGGSAL